jgi:Protein of unknown function (DUF998)
MTGWSTRRSGGMTSRGWFRLRLRCAAASAGVFAFAVIVIGSLTPGYDQRSDAVSRLASPGERWALAARAAFAAYGLLVVAGASTLRQHAGRHGHTLTRCLTLYGVACVIAGVAPKDQPGAAHTAVSQVHVAAAVLAGALAIGAMTLVARCGLTRATRRAAAAMTLLTGLAAGIFKYTWGTQMYGISERVLLGLGMCWISALAARALIASHPRPPADLRTNVAQLRVHCPITDRYVRPVSRRNAPCGIACGVPQGPGDAGVAGEAQDADDQVPERCHDMRSGAGSGGGGVLAEGDLANPVELVLDLPEARGSIRRAGLVGGQADERVAGTSFQGRERSWRSRLRRMPLTVTR